MAARAAALVSGGAITVRMVADQEKEMPCLL
jgi:hypothetical protein